MTFSNINVSSPNDGLGDKLRDAFVIVNDNFASIGEIVTPDYITATLSNYETIVDADASHTNLQNQITSLGYSLDLSEGSIQTLQTQVTNLGLLVDGKASLTQLNDSIAAINSTIASLQIDIDSKIGEAPIDGKTYGRKDGNWNEVAGGGSNYKVYSAIVNQSGNGNLYQVDISSGDLVIGRTYKIVDTDVDTVDFTNVGAPSNIVDTYFVASGTTPTSWGQSNSGKLETDGGCPVFNILENTIGDIIWVYVDKGVYVGTLTNAFTRDKTPTITYTTGPWEFNGTFYPVVRRENDDNIYIEVFDNQYNRTNDYLYNTFIEIKVYN